MSEGNRDRGLGMRRRITRRDFLNGVAVGIGALGCASLPDLAAGVRALTAGADSPKDYPPALTDLRGSASGSFDVAHALRDGTFWENAGRPADTHETYDLVVVGGGISGLAAAYFYRKHAGKDARILILDNNDDFGGHARRNEFREDFEQRVKFADTNFSNGLQPGSMTDRGKVFILLGPPYRVSASAGTPRAHASRNTFGMPSWSAVLTTATARSTSAISSCRGRALSSSRFGTAAASRSRAAMSSAPPRARG